MSAGKLFSPKNFYLSQRIQIAASFSNFNLTLADAKDPGNPILFESDQVNLFEPNAIASFVAGSQLKGSGHEEVEILQWINYADQHILPAMATWVFPTLGVIPDQKQQVEKAKTSISEIFDKINSHLEKRTFLVGERISLADITVASDLILLYEHVLHPEFRKNSPHVERWYLTVMNQPQVLKVMGGPPKLCEQEATFNAKKYHELHHQQQNKEHQQQRGGGRRGQRKSSGSQQQQHVKEPADQAAGDKKNEQKQQQQPKKKNKKDDDEEDDLPAFAREEKPKDPFQAFPAGTLNIEEWKRTYSNNDVKDVALPWLWEHFDAEHYSLWFCEYMYNHELTRTFMSANLMGGMLQRLDKMRKHAFGSLCLFGVDNDSALAGVWMWRGLGLAFELDSDLQLDYDLYSWRKLDVGKEEDKQLVAQYFIQTGQYLGKEFNQGKIFK